MFLVKNPVTEEGFIEVPITDDMIRIAEPRAKEIGKLKNSIRQGEGNLVGILGQMAAEKVIYGAYRNETMDFDIMGFDNIKIEVKAKDRTRLPQKNYEGSVPAANAVQRADYYLFISVLKEGGKYILAHICGYMPCNEYRMQAIFRKKGWVDTSNNFVVKADCFNMEYGKLQRFTKDNVFRDFGDSIRRKKSEIVSKKVIDSDNNINSDNQPL